MKRILLFAVVCLAALVACVQDLTPQDVADRFWRAAITAHPAKMQRYVRAADRPALERGSDILPVTAVEFGRAVIDGDKAAIETRVTLDGDEPLVVPIDTLLVREDAAWRVDYQATTAAVSNQSEIARVIRQIDEIGDKLKQGIDRSVGELQLAVPKVEAEISRIEAEINRRVPELRKRLDEFSRRLEDSLKQAPPPVVPLPPDHTKPI